VEGSVEHAAVGKPAIEYDRLDAHVAEQEIEIGGIECGQALLGFDAQILRGHVGQEFGPARALDRMGITVRDGADIQRKSAPPRRADAVDVVGAALAQDRSDMDDGDAHGAETVVEGIDWRHDFARARRRARTIVGGIEMAAVHVDRHDSRAGWIEMVVESEFNVHWLAVDIDAHSHDSQGAMVIVVPLVHAAGRGHQACRSRRARSPRPKSSPRWWRGRGSSAPDIAARGFRLPQYA